METFNKSGVEIIRQAGAKKGLRTDRQIAKAIGISYQTFSRKINGHADFTLKEIGSLRDQLDLSRNQIYLIFFASENEKNS